MLSVTFLFYYAISLYVKCSYTECLYIERSYTECHNAECSYNEAVFLVMWDPSMSELWATYTGLCLDLYGSRSLTARS